MASQVEDWMNLVAFKVVFCTYTWRWVSRELNPQPIPFPLASAHKTESQDKHRASPTGGKSHPAFYTWSQIIKNILALPLKGL